MKRQATLEGFILSEVSLTKENKYCMILLIRGMLKNSKNHRNTEQKSSCWWLREIEVDKGTNFQLQDLSKASESNVKHGDFGW